MSEGWRVVGFDIERHRYPKVLNAESDAAKRPGMNWSGSDKPGYKAVQFNTSTIAVSETEWSEYPGQLVIQDVLTLRGAQFRNASAIVASPPCQEFSYMAMPWTRAKTIAAEYRTGTRDVATLTALFDACFRIQREASEAAGRHIPMVVENVKGAQPWVGRARWHYGSFYLWGDVPALMPFTSSGSKGGNGSWFNVAHGQQIEGNCAGHPARGDNEPSRKNNGGSWFSEAHNTESGVGQNPVNGTKQGGNWWHDPESITRRHSSKSPGRKAASAQMAKIPFPLAEHIARCFKEPVHA